MDAAKMKEILKSEYGINNQKEFDAAFESMKWIDIGLFTMPLERSESFEPKKTA